MPSSRETWRLRQRFHSVTTSMPGHSLCASLKAIGCSPSNRMADLSFVFHSRFRMRRRLPRDRRSFQPVPSRLR